MTKAGYSSLFRLRDVVNAYSSPNSGDFDAAISHLPRKLSIAGIFAKEMRDKAHFRELAFRLANPAGL